MRTKFIPTSFLIGVLLAVMSMTLSAGQILWSSRPLAMNYTSQGSANPLDGSFVFELGTFNTEFSPTSSNTEQWKAQWTRADQVAYNPETRFFGSSYELPQGTSPFEIGQRLYIWGHNDGGEWILVTNPNWVWPPSGGLQFPEVISITTATEAIVGAINDASGKYHMQTAKVAGSAIDELSPDQWRSAHFSLAEREKTSLSSWEADPDRDGLCNLMEFAFGHHPRRQDPYTGPISRLVRSDGKSFMEWEIPTATANVRVHVESSSDMIHWQMAEGLQVSSDGDPSVILLRTPVSTHDGPRFVRLGVTLSESVNR